MALRHLIAIEAALALAAALIVAAILGRPLWPSGQSGAEPGLREQAAVRSVPPQTATAVPAAPSPPPPPVCHPAAGLDFMANSQILSYYGNPYASSMGILGELDPDALVADLKRRVEIYDALNGPPGIQPALHLVYATAQSDPGRDGSYLMYVDRRTVQRYIDLACENGMLIFLDLQIGRSDVKTQVEAILPYLRQAHVHVALDPEFAMPPGEIPGEAIGTLDAEDVNEAQAIIQSFVEKEGLPDKILVVHRFTDDMLTRPELLVDYPRVRLVVDMDGFGPAEIKRVKYGWYAAPAEHSGIKLFFKQDPDLMSEQDVLDLQPDLIIYQ